MRIDLGYQHNEKLRTPAVNYMYYDLRRTGFNCENLLTMNSEFIQSLLLIINLHIKLL